MRRIRWLVSTLAVIAAIFFLAVWAMDYQPLLALDQMPLEADELPFGPLVWVGASFVLSFLVYPWGPEPDKKRASEADNGPPQDDL